MNGQQSDNGRATVIVKYQLLSDTVTMFLYSVASLLETQPTCPYYNTEKCHHFRGTCTFVPNGTLQNVLIMKESLSQDILIV